MSAEKDFLFTREQLLERIREWGAASAEIRALLLIGSSARQDIPADAWSDIDLVLVAQNPDKYLHSTGWFREIAEPWIDTVERDGQGSIVERRVLFANGIDADFLVIPCDRLTTLEEEPLASIVRRGAWVVFDKDGLLPGFGAEVSQAVHFRPPSEEAFNELVNDFWFHVAWTAKKIRRGELWTAHSCCDDYLKRHLLTMLEWQAHGKRHEINTWYNGRFIERWAAAEVVTRLRDVFAHYDGDDLWRALRATLELFDASTRETARVFLYAYDDTQAERMRNWLASNQETDDRELTIQ